MSFIRQHEGDPCRHCGAVRPGPESTCIARIATAATGLAPEPKRREIACEDADIIAIRMAQIREAERPMCPLVACRTLYDCLRTAAQCGDSCPHRHEWVGPNEEGLK